jgi:kynureninase
MNGPDFARLDAEDPLAALHEHFDLPPDTVYLDGNSLGALPRNVAARMERTVRREWGADLVAGWNRHDWIGLPERVGERIAPLLGAAPGQVLCCDSISVNLFKLLSAALALRPGRQAILSEAGNFPTDLYMAEGLQALLEPGRCELRRLPADRILEGLDDDVAVLMLTHVDFRAGRRHDLDAITRATHEAGALVLWDLAHSAGVMPLSLDDAGVDLAVGCGYKYLNGGPGAPAFLYVAKRHQQAAGQPLAGWMGHARPFEFTPDYEPADGIRRYLAGTPGILGMAAMDAALDVFEGVSMEAVRRKSLALTACFIEAVDALDLQGVRLLTPRAEAARGSHVSLAHADGYAVVQAMIERRVIADFREPDIMRFGFSPLYNRYADVQVAVETLSSVLAGGEYREARFRRRARVT